MPLYIGMFMFGIVVLLTVITLFRGYQARREKELEDKIERKVNDALDNRRKP
ncbi:hypothetical protein [Paenibacillus senegalensis]|uniref:hypothetical protein n=1 Tax=Paenibacillus senegalensis TaxID=1465766 RepID=UPI00031B0369|nr:hypothetical protein [Paenibacillus senegalensis]